MRTFTFDTIADYRQAKYDGVTSGQTPEGVIHAALVGDSSVYSGSVVSKIKTGETFVDSINPFVTPDLGTDGDTLYKITDNGVVKYMYLRKGKTTWDSESFGQVFIKTDRLPTGSYTQVTNQSQVFTFADTKAEMTGSGRARMAKIKGNSLGWNQMVSPSKLISASSSNVTITANTTTGAFSFSGTANATTDVIVSTNRASFISGHKYLLKGATATSPKFRCNVGGIYDTGSGLIFTSASTDDRLVAGLESGKAYSGTARPIVIDLTLLYGTAISGLTDDQIKAKFEAEYPNPYYAYDAGSLLNFKGKWMKVAPLGLNIWDEEWEVGSIDNSSGQTMSDSSNIRSKNYCPCRPSTNYWVGRFGNKDSRIYWYDASKNFLSTVASGGSVITSPSNAAFFKYRSTSSYGNVYKNDACISLSGPRNGQYEPYKSSIIPINITSLRDSNHNLIFPNGAKLAGSTYDEVDIVAKKARVRVGTRAYASGDESDTSVTTDGRTYTNYALATPVEYDLSHCFFGTYPADEYVTKQLLPINGETPTTSPMSIEIQQL